VTKAKLAREDPRTPMPRCGRLFFFYDGYLRSAVVLCVLDKEVGHYEEDLG